MSGESNNPDHGSVLSNLDFLGDFQLQRNDSSSCEAVDEVIYSLLGDHQMNGGGETIISGDRPTTDSRIGSTRSSLFQPQDINSPFINHINDHIINVSDPFSSPEESIISLHRGGNDLNNGENVKENVNVIIDAEFLPRQVSKSDSELYATSRNGFGSLHGIASKNAPDVIISGAPGAPVMNIGVSRTGENPPIPIPPINTVGAHYAPPPPESPDEVFPTPDGLKVLSLPEPDDLDLNTISGMENLNDLDGMNEAMNDLTNTINDLNAGMNGSNGVRNVNGVCCNDSSTDVALITTFNINDNGNDNNLNDTTNHCEEAPEESEESPTTLKGIVKSYNIAGGYGFLTDVTGGSGRISSDINSDVKFRRDDLPGQLYNHTSLRGKTLHFELVKSQHGKLSAINLQDPESGMPTFKSHVKSWNPSKGFGFIECPGQLSDLSVGKDLFMSSRGVIDNEHLHRTDLPGVEAIFSVEKTAQGLSAIYVRFPGLNHNRPPQQRGDYFYPNPMTTGRLSPMAGSGYMPHVSYPNGSTGFPTAAAGSMTVTYPGATSQVTSTYPNPMNGSYPTTMSSGLAASTMASMSMASPMTTSMGSSMGSHGSGLPPLPSHPSHGGGHHNMHQSHGGSQYEKDKSSDFMKRRRGMFTGRQLGMVTSFQRSKFGFIRCDQLESEIFFMAPDAPEDIKKGDHVDFQVSCDQKTNKLRALDVKKQTFSNSFTVGQIIPGNAVVGTTIASMRLEPGCSRITGATTNNTQGIASMRLDHSASSGFSLHNQTSKSGSGTTGLLSCNNGTRFGTPNKKTKDIDGIPITTSDTTKDTTRGNVSGTTSGTGSHTTSAAGGATSSTRTITRTIENLKSSPHKTRTESFIGYQRALLGTSTPVRNTPVKNKTLGNNGLSSEEHYSQNEALDSLTRASQADGVCADASSSDGKSGKKGTNPFAKDEKSSLVGSIAGSNSVFGHDEDTSKSADSVGFPKDGFLSTPSKNRFPYNGQNPFQLSDRKRSPNQLSDRPLLETVAVVEGGALETAQSAVRQLNLSDMQSLQLFLAQAMTARIKGEDF